MKEPKLYDKVTQKMDELDALGEISPSAFWQESLLKRAAEIDHYKRKSVYRSTLSVVVIVSILINVGFIYNVLSHKSDSSASRVDNLQLISNEFFINPISLKN